MMKVTRAEKQKGRETCFVLAIKFGDQAGRRGEAQLWSPIARVNNRQSKRLVPPRVIQVEMQTAAGQRFYLGVREKN